MLSPLHEKLFCLVSREKFIVDDLIEMVSERADLSREKAEEAVIAVIEGLKDRLPKPFADKLDEVLSGEVGVDDLLGNIDIGGVGDLLDDLLGGGKDDE